MKQSNIEYLRSLKPAPHVSGKELLREGIEMGKSIRAKGSHYKEFANHIEYKKSLQKKGEIYWTILLGLATLDEQIEAIKQIDEFQKRTGFKVSNIVHIGSGNIGLPKECRENAPKTTSFMLETEEDWMHLCNAAPIDACLEDHHLTCPNSLETTVNAMKAGAVRIGCMSQFLWDYPGYNDNLERNSNIIRSLGIMASKRDQMLAVEAYLDDSFPSYFMDYASYVGYALLEHYVCSTLCNARYVLAFGGLVSEGPMRIAIALAIHELLSTEELPILTYVNGSTNMHWDHDIDGNYGYAAQEMLLAILAEKKYHMSLGINPVSITEKIAVPTLQELLNIFVCGKRVEEVADQWLPLVDFSSIEAMKDVMVAEAKTYFKNALEGFEAAGIDVEDPLEMLMVLKKISPPKLEQLFHSTSVNSESGEVKPFYPTVLGRQTAQERQQAVDELLEEGLHNCLQDKKVVVASGDSHAYGMLFVEGVLEQFGAQVAKAGVDMAPVDVLDLADEIGTEYVGISCHNGQALDYGKQLLELAKKRGRKYSVFMGGKLNAILPGDSEPTEIGEMLCEMGIQADNDIKTTVRRIASGECW